MVATASNLGSDLSEDLKNLKATFKSKLKQSDLRGKATGNTAV